MPIFWAWIGVFAAILMIQAVSKRVPSFEARGAPMIVGSFVSLILTSLLEAYYLAHLFYREIRDQVANK